MSMILVEENNCKSRPETVLLFHYNLELLVKTSHTMNTHITDMTDITDMMLFWTYEVLTWRYYHLRLV